MNNGVDLIRVQDSAQGSAGPVDIPERKDGVVVESRVRIYLLISPTIGSVVVIEQGRSDHGMIIGGIKDGFWGGFRGFDLYFATFFVDRKSTRLNSSHQIIS